MLHALSRESPNFKNILLDLPGVLTDCGDGVHDTLCMLSKRHQTCKLVVAAQQRNHTSLKLYKHVNM